MGVVLVIHPDPIVTELMPSTSNPALFQLNSIVVESNDDLAQYSTSGTGSKNDPYILRDIEVISPYLCVDIHDTDAFFIVRRCKLICTDALTPVVLLNQVENGTFDNCTIRGGNKAIEIHNSTNIRIINSRIYDSPRGIYLEDSERCLIQECKIFSNAIGLLLRNSDGSDINSNSVYSNSFIGLYIDENSNNNTVYLNKFGWNEENAVADGSSNQFFDSSRHGNVWSNYNDSEKYRIIGNGNFTDPYADILVDSADPIIESLDDIAIDDQESNYTIRWASSDEFPVLYSIIVNDDVLLKDCWDGGDIEYTISQLPLGAHVIEVILSDGFENTARDQIHVSVVWILMDDLGTPQLVLGAFLTVTLFFVCIVLIKKRS